MGQAHPPNLVLTQTKAMCVAPGLPPSRSTTQPSSGPIQRVASTAGSTHRHAPTYPEFMAEGASSMPARLAPETEAGILELRRLLRRSLPVMW